VKEKNVDMLHSLLGKKNVDVSRSQSFIIMNLIPLIELVKEKKNFLEHSMTVSHVLDQALSVPPFLHIQH